MTINVLDDSTLKEFERIKLLTPNLKLLHRQRRENNKFAIYRYRSFKEIYST